MSPGRPAWGLNGKTVRPDVIADHPVTAPATVGEGWVIAATVPLAWEGDPAQAQAPFASPETGQ